MKGVLHLVECHCCLPQFKNSPKPVYHKFKVFSTIDDGDTVVPKHSQCNNCGVIHHVVDICKSEIITGRDEIILLGQDDIRLMIPSAISNILSQYKCDLPTWEKALFIFQNEIWGDYVIIDKQESEEEVSGKMLKINSSTKFLIEPFFYRQTVER